MKTIDYYNKQARLINL